LTGENRKERFTVLSFFKGWGHTNITIIMFYTIFYPASHPSHPKSQTKSKHVNFGAWRVSNKDKTGERGRERETFSRELFETSHLLSVFVYYTHTKHPHLHRMYDVTLGAQSSEFW